MNLQHSAWTESDIIINGTKLTFAQAMTCRVALSSFIWEIDENGLGDDEHGKRMVEAYSENGHLILDLMFPDPGHSPP